MKTARTTGELTALRDGLAGCVGFVPTMGALHDGHLSLLRRARDECDAVVASVFVNPTQFGPDEDLERYPRDLDADARVLADAGCELLFAPSPQQMYPDGFQTRVEVGAVARPLEGERRPGHFAGVATVVLKLFHLVRPRRAYFGEKDAQQLAVIERMVADLDVPTRIVACPIVREADGLALSSRNRYLSEADRAAAPALQRGLQAARRLWHQGERRVAELERVTRAVLEAEPRLRIDYVAVVDPATFEAPGDVPDRVRVLLAAFLGSTRLIDNALLD